MSSDVPQARFLRLVLAGCAIGAILLFGTRSSFAADARFLGSLALLADESLAAKLELTAEQQRQVEQLIRRREAAALELAISARQLPAADRRARLTAFVEESERMARDLLTPDQQQLFQQVALAQEGLAALQRVEVAEQLGLSSIQRDQLQKVLTARDRELEDVDDLEKAVVRSRFERQLRQVLTPAQQSNWQAMSGQSTTPAGTATEDAVEGPLRAASTESTERGDETTAVSPSSNAAAQDGLLYFNFRYAPWKDVLDWFAEKADLSLVLEAPPPGTFNYSDNRGYTAADAIDLLNSVLLTKGYTLVRRERMLIVVNLEDGIPPNLVTEVPLEELEQRGTYELVRCRFPLGTMDAASVDQELTKLIGPQGRLEVLPQARQIVVTETAGRLRIIRDVLQAMADPTASGTAQVRAIPLKYITAEQAFPVIREMLGLPEELNAAPDGSLRMAPDPSGRQIMLTGQPDNVAQVSEILQLIDVPASEKALGGAISGTPQLEVYSVPNADSETALQILQTLLADDPTIRLATDPQTGHLVALARPSQHATIRATLEQLQRDAQQVEVLRLRTVDPQVAVLSINKLFGGGEEGSSKAPKVDADITTGQLLIRGTQTQIDQIRSLLQKMGETNPDSDYLGSEERRLRIIPLVGPQAEAILQQAQEIWPTLRENRIRTVTPSAPFRAVEPRRRELMEEPTEDGLETSDKQPPSSKDGAGLPAPNVTDLVLGGGPFAVSGLALTAEPPTASSDASNIPDSPTAPQTGEVPEERADIVVSSGPTGLLVASQDLEALNDFEDLLLTLANRQNNAARQFAIFYLRYATAEATAALLTDVLSGGSGGGDTEGGGDLISSLAGAALGDTGGGLVGSLLGLAGDSVSSLTSSGSFMIIPEPRLNFLIVRANPADMELIEQLLEMVDQRSSPEEVQTIAAPRLIPILNTSAESVAEVVRQVYANRMASTPGQPRQPSPEEFLRALRGGGRGGRGDNNAQLEQQQQMTLGVDRRSNSLVVGAPDDLFQEIQLLVEQLDQAHSDVMETARVITLKRVNPELVRQAVSAVVGSPPQATGGPTPQTSRPPTSPSSNNGPRPEMDAEGMRRRLEFFRALQQGMARPNPSPEPRRGSSRRAAGR